jgi:hypothetical protein
MAANPPATDAVPAANRRATSARPVNKRTATGLYSRALDRGALGALNSNSRDARWVDYTPGQFGRRKIFMARALNSASVFSTTLLHRSSFRS